MEYIKISGRDNVAVAAEFLPAGREVKLESGCIRLPEPIPAGHKFALCDIDPGCHIVKYGMPIGSASEKIPKGGWVHTHNLKTNLDEKTEDMYRPRARTRKANKGQPRFFQGYLRRDGNAGIRNEIWVIPVVGCVNDIACRIAEESRDLAVGTIDGVYAFSHPYGCSQTGEDHRRTLKIIAALASHPNAASVLLVRLGCENITQEQLEAALGTYDRDRIQILNCQDVSDEIAAGRQLMRKCAAYASGFCRQSISVEALKIGLKCGGSDGLSGITANPAAGAVSDLIVRSGGAAILTETPEMFGAERILAARCENETVCHKFVSMIQRYKQYFADHGEPVSENPSPGNKAGGISTLEEKSCGCVQKAGTMPVTDVLDYGDRAERPGVNLLYGPGNDLVSVTALAAAGAQLILFTTGRGTPLGAPVPVIKISSNTGLAEKKSAWIDFDAGELLAGKSLEEISELLFELVIAVAGGRETASEANGCRSMAVWKDGVTL